MAGTDMTTSRSRDELLELIRSLEGENARLKGAADREDASHGNTIDDRDAAEEALSQAYFLVVGRSPPWSNVFGRGDALEEIDDAAERLRQGLAPIRQEPKG
jgi:hypothetical protein